MSTLPKESDDELREWIADWQTDSEPAPEVREAIRRRVKRQSARMGWILAGEVVMTLGLLAIVVRGAVLRPVPLNLAAMAGLAVLILWAMVTSLWYRRGTWHPSAETTAAFLHLSILRSRRRLAAVRAGWFLLAVELAILIPWLYFLQSSDPAGKPTPWDYAVSFGSLALLTAFVVGVSLLAQRRARRELLELEEVRRNLEGS